MKHEAMLTAAYAEVRKDELEEIQRDARRYRWLRSRPLDTLLSGGVFAGKVPENIVMNGNDLDREIDSAMASET